MEFNKQGEPIIFYGIVKDITSNKLKSDELVESKNRLEFITNHAPVLIAECDANHRYKYVNKGYADFYNATP